MATTAATLIVLSLLRCAEVLYGSAIALIFSWLYRRFVGEKDE